MNERIAALETVNVPTLLYEAGLLDEAIAYCSGDALSVPLAQAYGLARALGAANNQAGRRLFSQVEHVGLDDPIRSSGMDDENDVAVEWARTAALFRPISEVISAIRSLVQIPVDGEDERLQESDTFWVPDDPWQRYAQMLKALIEDSATRAEWSAVAAIDSEVTTMLQEHAASRQVRTASLIELRVGAARALLAQIGDAEETRRHLDELLDSLQGAPLFHSTLLDLAELLAEWKSTTKATELLERLPYSERLTSWDLSDPRGGDVLDLRYRYWRLRFRLAGDASGAPNPIAPSDEAPAGSRSSERRQAPQDPRATELTANIDDAVRSLARLDAAITSGNRLGTSAAWSALTSIFTLFPPSGINASATVSMIHRQKPEMMRIAIELAGRVGDGLPQLLSEAFHQRFETQPQQWPLRLRLDVAEGLCEAGATAPWYDDTLLMQEEAAVFEDVHSRLDTLSDLIRRHARANRPEEARRLMRAVVRRSLGVGGRKDYQFDAWVAWLGRALSEPGGEEFVDEAAWLARLLGAVDRIPEGSRSEAAADLAALIVPADTIAAVRVFEYLVRNAIAPHLDAMAPLVAALVTRAEADDDTTLELATDVASELIAPAANRAYPELASTLVTAAARIRGNEADRALAESVARRTDHYALPTTRPEWRRGLGLPYEAAPSSDEPGDDYGSLLLADGKRIARTEVGPLIGTVSDIVMLRREESADSHFSWSPLVIEHASTPSDVISLEEAFADDPRRHCEVLATLAEIAEQAGDRPMALRLATTALSGAPGDAWASYYGGARRRASAVAIRLGGAESRVEACQDFVRQVRSSPWFPRTVILDLLDIAEALDSSLLASSVWPDIRTYLDGIAENVELPSPDVLDDHGCRWWLLSPGHDRRAECNDWSASSALAELAVGHLSHPTWLMRDAATTTVVRALRNGNKRVAEALARFAQPGASDDTLERAGRCLAGARIHEGFVGYAVLDLLEYTLRGHRSQVIRDLAATHSSLSRPLGLAYDLTLPGGAESDVGSLSVFPHPHGGQYRILANGLDLDIDAVLAVAAHYASEALAALPEQEAVRRALGSSGVGHTHALEEVAASRAAFGRVLADLSDAGLLDDAPPHVSHLLRTFDPDLIARTPTGRPDVIPKPPVSGREQTLDRWLAGSEQLLDDYVAASTGGDRLLLGARVHFTVLNSYHLEEEFVCGTTTATSFVEETGLFVRGLPMRLRDLSEPSASVRDIETGMPLVLENDGRTFNQIHAYWLALRPDIAAALGWLADRSRPGRWYTDRGDVAVDTTWWVDGWWGRPGPAFEDTEAQGHTVTLTTSGLADLTALLGDVTRHFTLQRRDDSGGGGPSRVTSTARSAPVSTSLMK